MSVAAPRNFWKLSVVPDSSERLTAVIGVSGRSASGLSSAMAGSFQVVMSWLKMPARVVGDSCRLSTPGRL